MAVSTPPLGWQSRFTDPLGVRGDPGGLRESGALFTMAPLKRVRAASHCHYRQHRRGSARYVPLGVCSCKSCAEEMPAVDEHNGGHRFLHDSRRLDLDESC